MYILSLLICSPKVRKTLFFSGFKSIAVPSKKPNRWSCTHMPHPMKRPAQSWGWLDLGLVMPLLGLGLDVEAPFPHLHEGFISPLST